MRRPSRDCTKNRQSSKKPVFNWFSGRRQREGEGRALARAALGGDVAAVAQEDAPADREAHAAALIGLGAVEALERLEDARPVLGREADAVVAHRDPRARI